MPAIPISDNPVQVSKSITQDALLQNIGSSYIFLDAQSSVSSVSYGLAVAPRSTVTWPANSELWAATSPGQTSSLSALYGASGAGLSEVSATVSGNVGIDGPVNIGTPVNVQGGGSILLNAGNVTVPPGIATWRDILPPGNGLTYYGLYFAVQLDTSDRNLEYVVLDSGNRVVANGSLSSQTTDTFGALAIPRYHYFTIPTTTGYPYSVGFYNFGGSSLNASVRVSGVSAVEPFGRTDWSAHLRSGFSYLPAVPWMQGQRVLLPASYQNYQVRLYNGASAGLLSLQIEHYIAGTWERVTTQAQVVEPTDSGTLGPSQARTLTIPGTGFVSSLVSTSNANTGLSYLTLIPPT